MAVDLIDAAEIPSRLAAGPWAEAWRRLRRNPMAIISGTVIILMVFAAIFAPWLATYGYDAPDRPNAVVLAGPGGHHPLGTDNLGLDTWSRLLYGARVSLSVGIIVVFIEVTIGIALGLLAAYKGGIWDTI